MPAAAVEKVFKHLHAAHDALARTVGRRQPSPTGLDPAVGDLPESGKRLQAAILGSDTLAACAPAAYQANSAQHPLRGSAPTHKGAAGCIARVPPSDTGPATGGTGEASSRPPG